MPQKWNLQDIRPSAPKATRASHRTATQTDIAPRAPRKESSSHYDDIDDIAPRGTSRKGSGKLILIVVAVLVVLTFILNVFLGGATVTVYPKVRDIAIQSEFTAYTAPQADELSYEVLTLSADAEKQVVATGKEAVAERATGKIAVYNTGSASQRLITNTRFETPAGLIFRIKDSIDVPGGTNDTPGKVVADVYADETGDNYNVQPTRFTVPGLKDTEQYTSIYAESAQAFTGGFEGDKYIIDEAELATALEELRGELRRNLTEQLQSKVPAGFILFDEAVSYTYESLPAVESGNSLATIKERAHIHAPLFNADELAAFLAEKSIHDYDGNDVYISAPEAITFDYTDDTMTQSDLRTRENITFTLEGNTKIISKFDDETLKEDIAGMHKNDAPSVFVRYGAISNATSEIRPFWKSSFPDDVADIKIVTATE